MFPARPATRLRRRSPRRGVSLVELLVVLAIMLIIFTMGGILIGPPLKRARLATVANDLTVLARRVTVEARTQRGGQGLFVFLKATPGTGVFELVADTNPAPAGDGVFQDPAGGGAVDSLITAVQPVTLPDGVVLYDMPAPYGPSWTSWGASGTSYVLGLDYQGRTVGPDGRQIGGVASVNLTLADMVSGTITPLVVHRLTFGSVWNVRHTQLVQDVAAPTGWREY